jgi:hypothetical protein
LDSQVNDMTEMITLGHAPAQPIPSFENGYLEPMACEDIGASKAREACTDDPFERNA